MNGAAEPSAPCFSPRRSSETAVRRVRASGMWEKTFTLWGRCGKKGKVLLLSPRTRREELDTLGASSTKQRRPNCQHYDKRLNMNGEMPTQESSNERFDQRSHARLLLPKHCWTNPLPSRKDPESTGCEPREPVPPPTFPPSPSAGPAATWCSKVLWQPVHCVSPPRGKGFCVYQRRAKCGFLGSKGGARIEFRLPFFACVCSRLNDVY